MAVVNYIVLLMIFFIVPAGVVWLCRRYRPLGQLGPIMVLYAIGMVIGNLPFIPTEIATLQEFLPNVLIPLAIPMMLYGCTFSRGEARLQCKIVASGFLATCIAVTIGYVLFGQNIEQGAEVGGIITGMYTGGTLNAAALQAIFKINGESFVLINSYDIIISFTYFVFLFSVGIKLFRRLYGEKPQTQVSFDNKPQDAANTPEPNPYRRLFTREGGQQLLRMLGDRKSVV